MEGASGRTVPQLVRLWNEHAVTLGRNAQVTMAVLEQAILARSFFDAELLLVAQSQHQLDGWCMALPDPLNRDAATVAAIARRSRKPGSAKRRSGFVSRE